MKRLNHKKTPVYTALNDYVKHNIVHFDVPGHKKRKGLGGIFDKELMKYDANSTKDLDMLSNPTGAIREAEELLADAYGADSAFMLVNGSTFGVQAMIMAAVGPNEKIMIPRNIHKSAINGVILSGAVPVFIEPEIDYGYGIANSITIEGVRKTVKEHPDVKAILLINPTYFGAASDIKSIIAYCRRKNITVLSDEAHGAHFPFHNEFPPGAIPMGADMATASLHKTGGSLTQSSVLLLNEYRFKRYEIRSIINLMQTTSASYLLLSSIDLARKELVLNGQDIFTKLLKIINETKAKINSIKGISCITRENINGKGIFNYDETKIVIKVNELGLTGFQVYDILKEKYNIQMELAETYCVLAVCGVGDDEYTLNRLYEALSDISKNYYGKLAPFTVSLTDFFEKPKTVISPRDAFYSPKRIVPADEAVGEICGESLMIYPPGIPLIIPGERITEKIIEHYWFYVKQGCVVMNDEGDYGKIQILGSVDS